MTEAENAAIKRQVYFERVKNARADKVLSLLDDADKRIAELLRKTKGVETRKRYNEIAKAIEALSKALRERIAEGLDTEEIIDSELDAQRKFINGYCGVKTDNFTLPATGQVLTAAEFAPIVGSMTYQSYLDGIRDGLFNAWDSAVRTGYLTGETTQSIVKRVLGSTAGNAKLADAGEIATLRNSVWRNTRTALQSFARVTRDAVYEANADIFSGYKFLATLDKRTCPVCGALDGKIYKRLEDVPKVPLHYNCRCIALAVVKGFDFSDTRASMNGKAGGKITYEEWLRAQPPDVQRDVLGTTRYKLCQTGAPLDGFIDNGRVMTVKELNEKMNSKG